MMENINLFLPIREPKENWVSIIVNQWISMIEMNKERFGIVKFNNELHKQIYCKLAVKYDEKILFYIIYYRHYVVGKGKSEICAFSNIEIPKEGNVLFDDGCAEVIYISDENLSTISIICSELMRILPLREQYKVDRIAEVFNISPSDILFDSLKKRYVIKSLRDVFSWSQDKKPKTFYKYISLSVYNEIIKNRTFRMNSIVSQSDTTETLYLGDFLSHEYDDEQNKFHHILNESNVLISSFTTIWDNPEMWYEYGGRGKGVCLGFELLGNTDIYQVHYVDENSTHLNEYREKSMLLNKEGIEIHFEGVDEYYRFTKNNKYQNEKEWRLVSIYNSRIDFTMYGDRIVYYHDFPLIGNEIPEIGIRLVSVDIGPIQPDGTTNFPLVASLTYDTFGRNVRIGRSKLKEDEIKNIICRF